MTQSQKLEKHLHTGFPLNCSLFLEPRHHVKEPKKPKTHVALLAADPDWGKWLIWAWPVTFSLPEDYSCVSDHSETTIRAAWLNPYQIFGSQDDKQKKKKKKVTVSIY